MNTSEIVTDTNEDSNNPILLEKVQILLENKVNGKITDPYLQGLLGIGPAYWLGETDAFVISKIILSSLASYIPVVGNITSAFINIFWPSTQINLWEQIRNQVEQLVGEKVDQNTWNILSGTISNIYQKLNTFYRRIDEKKWDLARESARYLSNELDGIEKQFKIPGLSRSYYHTPLFTAMVNLILSFRLECINNGRTFLLTDGEIQEEKALLNQLMSGQNGAIQYIKNETIKLKSDMDQALTAVPSGWGVGTDERYNTDYNGLMDLYSYYMMSAFSDVEIWSIRSQYPTQTNLPIHLKIALPQHRVGKFQYDFSNSKELFNKMLDIPENPANYNHYSKIDQVTLVEMKPGQPYRRCAGIEVVYETGEKETYGYFGGGAGPIPIQKIEMKGLADKILFRAQFYNSGVFVDQAVFTALKPFSSISAGTPGSLKG